MTVFRAAPIAPVRELVIVGAGATGRRLAERAARAGYSTVLQDLLPSSRLRAVTALRAEVEDAGGDPAPVLANIRMSGSLDEALAAADLVIETTPDELESKHEMFTLLDRMAPRYAILVAVTALPLDSFSDVTCREESCVAVRLDLDADRAVIAAHAAMPPAMLARVAEVFDRLGFNAGSNIA